MKKLSSQDLQDMVAGGQADWEKLRDQHIFLTGGTGFFGKWLLAAFSSARLELDLNFKVTVLSRAPGRFLADFPFYADLTWLNFLAGDVLDRDSYPKGKFDRVIHAATDTIGVSSPAEEEQQRRIVVEGTRKVIDFARAAGAEHLMLTSSGAIYGALVGQPGGASEEDGDQAQPISTYGKAKREAEQLCLHSGLQVTIARCFAFLGPYLALDAHFAAGNFLRDALRGGPIQVRGDGRAVRSYLYPTDLILWLLAILVRGESGRAYNVGSDQAVTVGDLARQVAVAAGGEVEVQIQNEMQPGPQNIYLPQLQRARQELHLDIQVTLNEAIRRTLNFHRIEAGTSSRPRSGTI